MSDEPTPQFTLYLKGGAKDAILRALKPFGNPGDADRYLIESCGAEVILGTEVALVRIPLDSHEVAVKELIDGLRQSALTNNLALGDDVNSSKSADQLYANYQEERSRTGKKSASQPGGEGKGHGSTVAILVLLGIGFLLAIVMWHFLSSGADNVGKSLG